MRREPRRGRPRLRDHPRDGDNLYKEHFGPQAMGLADSFAQFKEVYVHSLLNTGTTYNQGIVGDGQPLFSTTIIDNGTYANRPSPDIDFNEAAVEYALNTIRLWPDQAGNLAMVRARKCVLPVALSWAGERLFKTELRTGTTNNDVSALVTSGAIPEGYMVSEFLTSAFAWFIVTSVHGLLVFDRVPLRWTSRSIRPPATCCASVTATAPIFTNPRRGLGAFRPP